MLLCGLWVAGAPSVYVLGVSFIPWLGWTSLGGINSTAGMFTEMFSSVLLFLSSLAKKCKKSISNVCGRVLLALQQESSTEGYIRGFLCVVGDVEDVMSPFLQLLQGRLW